MARSRWFNLAIAAALAAAALLSSHELFAQRRPSRRPAGRSRGPQRSSTTTAIETDSLLGRFGISAAQVALKSQSREERVRGIRRLSSQNDYESIQYLIRIADEGPSNFADGWLRLEYVKALAPFASRDLARARLGKILVEEPAIDSTGGLSQIARKSAALALAATGDNRAFELLIGVVMRASGGAEAATAAILAHPPPNMELVLSAPALTSIPVIELLGELKDLRAIPSLRKVIEKDDINARTAAAVSLAKLGDEFAASSARSWLSQAGSTNEQREAATRTLVLLRASDAPRAVAILLAEPTTRDKALGIALEAPSPQIAPSLAGFLSIATGEQRHKAILAIARAGGATAIHALEQQITKYPEDRNLGFALAHCTDSNLNNLLNKLLSAPATRLMAARASIVRWLETGEEPDAFSETLSRMLASPVAVDRQTAAFGLALRRTSNFDSLLKAKEPAIVRATCSAALALGDKERRACASLVASSADPMIRCAAAGSLFGNVSPHDVSTLRLLDLLESEDPSYGAVARALGARDSEVFRPRIRRLLAAGNPVLRAQLSLGLAQSQEASVVSILSETYETEPDPTVRRAIVRALSARTEVQRLSALRHAADLDPDNTVRTIALAALAGRNMQEPENGRHVAWLWVDATNGGISNTARAALVVSSTGLAIPVVSDDDGSLLVPGLPPGDSMVLLASIPASQQSSPK